MSYKYDPYTDSFTHINDEGNITISLNCQNQQARIVKYAELSDETIDAIADAVAAKMQTTVQPKMGKWIWLSSTYDRTPCEMRFMCDQCHHEVITHDTRPWEKYCPNCGKRMKGAGDGND